MRKLIPSIAILAAWASVAMAAAQAPLATLRAIHSLSRAEAAKALPVLFEGTVTFFAPGFRYLFVQDQGLAIFVYAPEGTMLAPGDRVLVRGVTNAEYRSDVTSDSIALLHHGALPTPHRANFEELMKGQIDCLLVTVRGKVRAANMVLRPDVRNKITLTTHVPYLELLTDGGYVNVIVNGQDENALKDMLDADVEVTGAAGGIYDGKWHHVGVLVRAPSFSTVKVLKRASVSPWSLPVTPMENMISGYRVHDLSPRVHLQGTITYYQPGYYRPGSAIVLQSGSESLWVESLTDEPLRVGNVADVTGIPDVANGSPILTHAAIKDTPAKSPVTPLNVTWEQLANADVAGKHHYDLVSIEGRVVMEVREASQDQYVLVHQGQLFSAIFHHPDSTSQLSIPPMKQVDLGSMVRVTGICILQDTTLYSGKAPFNILLRSFDDIAVVGRPSWMNIPNLAGMVIALLLAVIAIGVWGGILMGKVHRQTSAMAVRIEAEAALERRRSAILEDINGSRPLAEVLEEIAEMVAFMLDGAPCWCEVADGARLGNYPPDADGLHVVHEEIPSRSGPPLGRLFAGLPAGSAQTPHEKEALSVGSRLATLAIETRRLYSDLLHRSEFDLLTDTHNRFSLESHLDAQIAEARLKAGIFGLIYIDLDGFKKVNDLYGHHVGDLYLQEVALRMKGQLRSVDKLARLGGDEFAALVPAVRNRAEVGEIAERLERSFDDPFEVEGFFLQGAASVGIALYPEDAATRDALLTRADTEMYSAKNAKKQDREMRVE
jgi:diguanylate cyclase (GGDEF)-like protein